MLEMLGICSTTCPSSSNNESFHSARAILDCSSKDNSLGADDEHSINSSGSEFSSPCSEPMDGIQEPCSLLSRNENTVKLNFIDHSDCDQNMPTSSTNVATSVIGQDSVVTVSFHDSHFRDNDISRFPKKYHSHHELYSDAIETTKCFTSGDLANSFPDFDNSSIECFHSVPENSNGKASSSEFTVVQHSSEQLVLNVQDGAETVENDNVNDLSSGSIGQDVNLLSNCSRGVLDCLLDTTDQPVGTPIEHRYSVGPVAQSSSSRPESDKDQFEACGLSSGIISFSVADCVENVLSCVEQNVVDSMENCYSLDLSTDRDDRLGSIANETFDLIENEHANEFRLSPIVMENNYSPPLVKILDGKEPLEDVAAEAKTPPPGTVDMLLNCTFAVAAGELDVESEPASCGIVAVDSCKSSVMNSTFNVCEALCMPEDCINGAMFGYSVADGENDGEMQTCDFFSKLDLESGVGNEELSGNCDFVGGQYIICPADDNVGSSNYDCVNHLNVASGQSTLSEAAFENTERSVNDGNSVAECIFKPNCCDDNQNFGTGKELLVERGNCDHLDDTAFEDALSDSLVENDSFGREPNMDEKEIALDENIRAIFDNLPVLQTNGDACVASANDSGIPLDILIRDECLFDPKEPNAKSSPSNLDSTFCLPSFSESILGSFSMEFTNEVHDTTSDNSVFLSNNSTSHTNAAISAGTSPSSFLSCNGSAEQVDIAMDPLFIKPPRHCMRVTGSWMSRAADSDPFGNGLLPSHSRLISSMESGSESSSEDEVFISGVSERRIRKAMDRLSKKSSTASSKPHSSESWALLHGETLDDVVEFDYDQFWDHIELEAHMLSLEMASLCTADSEELESASVKKNNSAGRITSETVTKPHPVISRVSNSMSDEDSDDAFSPYPRNGVNVKNSCTHISSVLNAQQVTDPTTISKSPLLRQNTFTLEDQENAEGIQPILRIPQKRKLFPTNRHLPVPKKRPDPMRMATVTKGPAVSRIVKPKPSTSLLVKPHNSRLTQLLAGHNELVIGKNRTSLAPGLGIRKSTVIAGRKSIAPGARRDNRVSSTSSTIGPSMGRKSVAPMKARKSLAPIARKSNASFGRQSLAPPPTRKSLAPAARKILAPNASNSLHVVAVNGKAMGQISAKPLLSQTCVVRSKTEIATSEHRGPAFDDVEKQSFPVPAESTRLPSVLPKSALPRASAIPFKSKLAAPRTSRIAMPKAPNGSSTASPKQRSCLKTPLRCYSENVNPDKGTFSVPRPTNAVARIGPQCDRITEESTAIYSPIPVAQQHRQNVDRTFSVGPPRKAVSRLRRTVPHQGNKSG